MSVYSVYILRCADGTLYTGITTDVARRLTEHNTSPQGARYTRGRRPVALIWSQSCQTRRGALREEARIKALSRAQKELLLSSRRGENEE